MGMGSLRICWVKVNLSKRTINLDVGNRMGWSVGTVGWKVNSVGGMGISVGGLGIRVVWLVYTTTGFLIRKWEFGRLGMRLGGYKAGDWVLKTSFCLSRRIWGFELEVGDFGWKKIVERSWRVGKTLKIEIDWCMCDLFLSQVLCGWWWLLGNWKDFCSMKLEKYVRFGGSLAGESSIYYTIEDGGCLILLFEFHLFSGWFHCETYTSKNLSFS